MPNDAAGTSVSSAAINTPTTALAKAKASGDLLLKGGITLASPVKVFSRVGFQAEYVEHFSWKPILIKILHGQNAASIEAIAALTAEVSMSSAPIHHPAISELRNAAASALPMLVPLAIE